MGCFKMKRAQGISSRVAKQMRTGIAAGELAYNSKVKGDLKAARKIMWRVSKAPKYTYLSALHTLANCMSCKDSQVVL